MSFDPFVIPFSAGALILFAVLITRYALWIVKMPRADRRKAWKGLFTRPFFVSIWEVFSESLLHRRIFRVNNLLGFMHMSFAFGWFLLIIMGTIESKLHKHHVFNMPWDPIFLRYFAHDISGFKFAETLTFIMDFLLFILLSATLLAISKRIYSRLFGMKRTTKLRYGDQIALYSLWSIFPMRFLAESFTAGLYHNGGFLTQTAGNAFASFLPLNTLEYPAWWMYSSMLCLFFISLPFSRYMHIPTEVLLIYFRNCGIKTGKKETGVTEFEVYSCPRCGICIDKCQLSSAAGIHDTQGVYFLQDYRRNVVSERIAQNCLFCGRCNEYCPVKIDIVNLRLLSRVNQAPLNGFDYQYLYRVQQPQQAEVLYFAGCMTHLTPKIKRAMINILISAGVNYHFLDENGSICCGRPLMISGNIQAANELIKENKFRIKKSGASTLVTSCPICLKVFKEEYGLEINVLHHTEYINQLVEKGLIALDNSRLSVAYHDPCELGRGLGIYEQPRQLLNKVASLHSNGFQKENSLCCGGSLADTTISTEKKNAIAVDAVKKLVSENVDVLATACPLCKKTFSRNTDIQVKDIAELVSENLKS